MRILEFLVPLLEVRSESEDSGWPEVKPEEVTMFRQVVLAITMAKWGRDSDGDLPIQTKIVDRTRYRSDNGIVLPYDDPELSLRELFGILDMAISNVTGDIDAFKGLLRSVGERLDRKEVVTQPPFVLDEGE